MLAAMLPAVASGSPWRTTGLLDGRVRQIETCDEVRHSTVVRAGQ
jgi:hypothetical protein